MSKSQSFIQGALVLSVATAVVKVIGALFKLPLFNFMDDGGATHFNMAYQIYATLFTVATAGLPAGVAKMVSESETHSRFQQSRRILGVALKTYIAIGILGSVALYTFADFFATHYHNPEGAPVIRAIAPAIFFVSVIAAFRGYHQGRRDMVPTAISQVIEAFGKLVFGLGLAYYLYKTAQNPVSEAVGAITGVTIGTVMGSAYLLFRSRKLAKPVPPDAIPPDGQAGIFSKLIKIAVPITISASILSLTNLLDGMQVLGRLKFGIGLSKVDAEFLSDSYVIANALFSLPSAFVLTLAISILPAVAAAMARGDRTTAAKNVSTSLRVTLLLALPAAAGLSALSRPILSLLYASGNSADKITIAAPLLTTLGLAVPFVCLVTLTNSILQSLGKYYLPLISMSIGAAIKLSANYVLIGTPDININGAPIGTLLCYAVISLINLTAIIMAVKPPHMLSSILKPLVAAIFMGIAAWRLQIVMSAFISDRISTAIAILVGVALYAVFVLVLKALTYDDIILFPKGKRLAAILKISPK
ncbi:sporulation protein SpoVB [Clostridia bacterium]|nr:sporulation protein SpoVB [Clostridia bacterium]